jgi:protein gp37
MADKTGIEWTDATWNPTVGCKLVSPGCTNCYAMKVAARMESISIAHSSAHGGDPGPMYYYRDLVTDTRAGPVWNGTFREAPFDLLERPLRWKRPRRIFVNSMSDLFGEGVPYETIDKVFAVMAMCPQHTFQILTKRPERMRDYLQPYSKRRADGLGAAVVSLGYNGPLESLKWPLPNVWLGVSVEDQKRADERIPILFATPAAIRWISAEPLLGPVDLEIATRRTLRYFSYLNLNLHWVVVGGESGPGSRPMHPDWARSLRDQCKAAGVAFLFKQWGEWFPCNFTVTGSKERIVCRSEGFDLAEMHRVGKKRAGRLLDGVEHNEYPATK